MKHMDGGQIDGQVILVLKALLIIMTSIDCLISSSGDLRCTSVNAKVCKEEISSQEEKQEQVVDEQMIISGKGIVLKNCEV